ncbi:MAG: class I SAM-dependent methyltransferase, partial [Nitrospinaceae bacterium]
RCMECGLEFVNPLPSEEHLEENYAQEMKSDAKGTPYFLEYINERTHRAHSFEKVYKSRLDLIERFSGHQGNLLDIGCSAGFFLQYAQSRGWNCHGIDLLSEYIEYGRRTFQLKNLHSEPLENIPFEPEYFDVATLWDLIEHLQHPLSYLRRVHEILRPGGLLAVWTPNTKNAVCLKDQWTGYWPRQHLYFFSRDTLNNLLERAGFRIVFCKTTKTKKGLFRSQDSLTFEKIVKPEKALSRTWFAVKRDFGNFINPMTYLSPLLDRTGYGFNLLVIASKQ